jgi:hypothetical protein
MNHAGWCLTGGISVKLELMLLATEIVSLEFDAPGTSDLMLLDLETRKQNMSMHSMMMMCDMNWKMISWLETY